MTLFKRGNIWWTAFYMNGVRHQQSTRTRNRRAAERVEQQMKDDATARTFHVAVADPIMTFGALAARFVSTASPRPHHLDRLRHLLPFFADMALRDITKPIVREYRQTRHARKQLCDATINRDVAVLRHLMYWAVDEGLLPNNPLTRLRLAQERRAPRPVVTIAEEERLLGVAPPHLGELIIAALDTGMRRGELYGQRWEHVDLERRIVAVSRSKTVQGEGREIPLTSRLYELLNKRRAAHGVVFTYLGRPIGTTKTSWLNAVRSAGIRSVRFHDLRHTFNTRLLEAGVLQEVRKALMGHVSGQGVHGVYTHVELPLKRAAIASLDRWLSDQRVALSHRSSTTTQEE